MTSIIALMIIEFIKRYQQKSSFILLIDGKTRMYTLDEEDNLVEDCKGFLESQVEGEDPEFEFEQIRADGNRIVICIKTAEKIIVKEIPKGEVYKDEKLERMMEKKLKK